MDKIMKILLVIGKIEKFLYLLPEKCFAWRNMADFVFELYDDIVRISSEPPFFIHFFQRLFCKERLQIEQVSFLQFLVNKIVFDKIHRFVVVHDHLLVFVSGLPSFLYHFFRVFGSCRGSFELTGTDGFLQHPIGYKQLPVRVGNIRKKGSRGVFIDFMQKFF